MKINKYFMLGLAGLAFAACSNDEDITNQNEEGKAIIKISFGNAESRALGETIDTKYNSIKDFTINFYTRQGVRVAVPDVYINEKGDEYDNKAKIAAAEKALQDGATSTTLEIRGVPNSAYQVYIVANEPTVIENGNEKGLDYTSISKIKESRILLSSQKDCLNSTLTSMDTGVITDGTVSAVLTPVTSRLELQNLIAEKKPTTWTGAEIVSFQVRGIYLNAFIPWGTVNGSNNDQITQVGYADEPSHYTTTHYAQTPYSYNGGTDEKYNFSFMCDGDDISGNFDYVSENLAANEIQLANTKSVTEGETTKEQWWGYPLLPATLPHLVIKLSVIYEGETTPVDRFLVVQKYKKDEQTISSAERCKVYQIKNLRFNASNLTQVPYEGVQTITATITVAQWASTPIQPDFGPQN